MSPLRQEYCSQQVTKLSENDAHTLLQQLSNWQHAPGNILQREFKFKNYYHVMSFVNAVAWIANKEGHHPDMEVSYGRVLVQFTTHDVDGLSCNDFICAAKVDALFEVGNVGPVLT